MRLPIDRPKGLTEPSLARRFGAGSINLGLILALAGCGIASGGSRPAEGLGGLTDHGNGPQADYPVVIGEPYTVAGTAYTPIDVMNYDEVGYVTADNAGGNSVTGAHHTLPLPSYVEVTSLETGKTILVRLERRGPMDNNRLLALSSGALLQLGGNANAPVRVRRVNPPEDQRALLRSGEVAPPRMDTPMSLVEVLKRKLPASGATAVAGTSDAAPSRAQITSVDVPASAAATPAPTPIPALVPSALPVPAPPLPPIATARTPVPPAAAPIAPTPTPAPPTRPSAAITSGFVVQAGAYSSAGGAQRVASAIEGSVSRAGNLYRVRTGPFASRAQAEASLAKVRAAGYRDARIFTSD